MVSLPRPSTVIATVALVLSCSGVGYAAAKITSKDIRDNTIQSRDIRDGSIAPRDLRGDVLAGVGASTGAASTPGVAGAQGATGPQGPAGTKGDTGAPGPQGPAGAKGETGTPGTPGTPGPPGGSGPAGSQGPAGPQGPAGITEARRVRRTASAAAANVNTAIVNLTSVPAGTWVISARTTLLNNEGATRHGTCIIERNDVEQESAVIYSIPAITGVSFSMQSIVTTTSPSTIGFGCEVDGTAGTAEFTSVIATPVTSATTTGS